MREFLTNFLTQLFTVALKEEALFPSGQEPILYSDYARRFYDCFAQPARRKRFYDTVVKQGKALCSFCLATCHKSFILSPLSEQALAPGTGSTPLRTHSLVDPHGGADFGS